MLVERVTGSVGVWRVPGFAAGLPGTYALIIGISEYSAPTISGLHTSAFTAARFFDWLASEERYSFAPVRECRLLLSPTLNETDVLSQQFNLCAQDYQTATFAHIEGAILEWRSSLAQLTLDEPESRAIFYFCGHGVEYAAGRQILLPADYRSLPGGANRAIATNNLLEGLGDTRAKTQIFLLDACRNNGPLRDIVPPIGYPILDTPTRSLPRQAITLNATIGGSVTAQFNDVGDGGSFFGLALHEALTASSVVPPIFEPDCRADPCVVRLSSLLKYLNDRVRTIFEFSPNVSIVNVGGQITDFDTVIAELPSHRPKDSSRSRAPETIGSMTRLSQGLRWTSLNQSLDPSRFNSFHNAFHHEWITSYILGAVLYSSHDARNWLPASGKIHALSGEASERNSTLRFRPPLSDEPMFYWLVLPYSTSFLIPPTLSAADFELQTTWVDQMPDDTSLDLSLTNSGQLADAATMWRQYRDLSSLEPFARRKIEQLAKLLFTGKECEPLTAQIAILTTLRASAHQLIRDWDLTVADLSRNSDGAVMALSHRLMPGVLTEPGAIERLLSKLAMSGIPTLSPSYGLMLSLWERSDRITTLGQSENERTLFQMVRSRLGPIVEMARSTTGLFAKFATNGPHREARS